VHTSTGLEGLLTQLSGTVPGRKPGSGRPGGNLSRSLRGVSWMMSWRRWMETSAGGPVSSVHGRHTGVSASALRMEHGLGMCTGCRAGCQMWPAFGRPLVSLSLALLLLRQNGATIGNTRRRSARRVADGGPGPLRLDLTVGGTGVEEEVCVESSSLRKNFESVLRRR